MQRRGFLGTLAALVAVPSVAKHVEPASAIRVIGEHAYVPTGKLAGLSELRRAYPDDIDAFHREAAAKYAQTVEFLEGDKF